MEYNCKVAVSLFYSPTWLGRKESSADDKALSFISNPHIAKKRRLFIGDKKSMFTETYSRETNCQKQTSAIFNKKAHEEIECNYVIDINIK